MEFRRGHLRYFVTIAEEGQVTRAARKLHLAQPALSQAIAQLESDLGVALLERHARGVTLTPAGEVFLVKARAAVCAWTEAVAAARSLATLRPGTVEFGFVGVPPGVDSPGPLEAFALAHPHIDLRYRELPFPSVPMSAWLEEVDVAVCHSPRHEDGTWSLLLRREPRVVLAPSRHPLAARREVGVADVLGEIFIGFHPSVDPSWAGFWSLDDHRGSPAATTADRAANPQEVIAALSVRSAITTVPASVARTIMGLMPGVATIELCEAAPAAIVLVGRDDRLTPQVEALRVFAERGPPGPGERGARPRSA